MPIISRFFGILVTMNYREHDPPHSMPGTQDRKAQSTLLTARCKATFRDASSLFSSNGGTYIKLS